MQTFPKSFKNLFLIVSLFMWASAVPKAVADCKVCKKLKRAEFIGVKSVKQFLSRSSDITVISSEKKAKQQGLSPFTSCPGNSVSSKATSSKCKPAFAVLEDNIYFCPKQLKAFKTQEKAESAGYSNYTACDTRTPVPTPTATPAATPLPLDRTFTQESGIRFTDVDSISIARLPNGEYRSYLAASDSPFDPDTLRFADSADGLSFGNKTAIAGITPEALETFASPAFLALDNGSFIMIYEEIKHISSAAVDISNLMRATSPDGLTFSYEPQFVVIPGGSSLASRFQPSLVIPNQGTLMLYYRTTLGFESVTSTDLGLSFTEAEQITILGRSDSYAPFPGEPSVVIDSDGTYLMFFSSIITSEIFDTSIFLAASPDGRTFNIYSEPILLAPSGVSYREPTAVVLPNGGIRVYYIEREGSFPNVTRSVKSLLFEP